MVQDLMKDSACGNGLSEDSAVTPLLLALLVFFFPMVSFNVLGTL